MSYRTIVVGGQTYKWKVGRKCIEVRREKPKINRRASPANWKTVVDRPAPQKRWGLITPNMETSGLNIAIFTNEKNCIRAFAEAKKNSSCKDQVELIFMPPKPISITPAWIEKLIKEKKVGLL